MAKRPETICPFLGLASSQIEYHTAVTREHRCYAFGAPAELSAEQQERVCLGRGYVNCPRYLRGVLVIPTDEPEALHRPPPPVRPPTPPPPPPRPTSSGSQPGRGGRLPLLIGLVLLLAVGATTGAILLLQGPGTAVASPTAQPSSQPSPSASVIPSASVEPTPANQTPFPETPRPDPTPLPGDTFVGFEVTVLEGQNTIFEVDDQGTVVGARLATYSRFSLAPVDRIEAPNGLLHWRTSAGDYTGLSYIHDDSGPFLIRAVYEGSDGQRRYTVLPDDEV